MMLVYVGLLWVQCLYWNVCAADVLCTFLDGPYTDCWTTLTPNITTHLTATINPCQQPIYLTVKIKELDNNSSWIFDHIFYSGESRVSIPSPTLYELSLHVALLEQPKGSVCVRAGYIHTTEIDIIIIDDCVAISRVNCPIKESPNSRLPLVIFATLLVLIIVCIGVAAWYCRCCRRLRLRTGLLSLSTQSLQEEAMAVPYSDNPSVANGGVMTMHHTAGNGMVFNSPTVCNEFIITNSETHIGASTPQVGICRTVQISAAKNHDDTTMLVSDGNNEGENNDKKVKNNETSNTTNRATFIAAINAGSESNRKNPGFKSAKKTKHKNRSYLPSEGSDTTRITEHSEEIDMQDVALNHSI